MNGTSMSSFNEPSVDPAVLGTEGGSFIDVVQGASGLPFLSIGGLEFGIPLTGPIEYLAEGAEISDAINAGEVELPQKATLDFVGRGVATVVLAAFSAGMAKLRCFPGGTLVAADGELLPIEEIEVGQLVVCVDPVDNNWGVCIVERTLVHVFEGELVSLIVDGEHIEATWNHPFWVVAEGKGRHAASDAYTGDDRLLQGEWLHAQEIGIGDRMLAVDGRQVVVESLAMRSGRLRVYDLQVSDLHTFAVGEVGVVVHNKKFRPNVAITSRINISKAGLLHTLQAHLRPGNINKSQFSIGAAAIKDLVGSKQVVGAAVKPLTSGQFVREIDVGRTIGRLRLDRGGQPTSILTVITDAAGNLVTAFPGVIDF